MNQSQRLIGLIPAAGSGSRVGGETPKQYLRIGHQSMLEHSIDALAADRRVSQIFVVVAPDDRRHQALAQRPGVSFVKVGGTSRAASVLNGLCELRAADDDWVLVHDAARPCLSAGELGGLIDGLEDDPVGGLLAVPLADTLKRSEGDRVAATIPREALWRAATPQMFRVGRLRCALEAVRDPEAVTDEAYAIERLGLAPRLVAGSSANIKVTTAQDFALADAILGLQGRLT